MKQAKLLYKTDDGAEIVVGIVSWDEELKNVETRYIDKEFLIGYPGPQLIKLAIEDIEYWQKFGLPS